jgi:hypothetical protein
MNWSTIIGIAMKPCTWAWLSNRRCSHQRQRNQACSREVRSQAPRSSRSSERQVSPANWPMSRTGPSAVASANKSSRLSWCSWFWSSLPGCSPEPLPGPSVPADKRQTTYLQVFLLIGQTGFQPATAWPPARSKGAAGGDPLDRVRAETPNAQLDHQANNGHFAIFALCRLLSSDDQVMTANEGALRRRMTPASGHAETRRNRVPHGRLGRQVRYRLRAR